MTALEKARRNRAVVDAFAVTRDLEAVGARFGLSAASVRNLWTLLGRTGEEKAATKRAQSARRRRVAADYQAGKLVKLIAYEHGVSEVRVIQIAKREGVALRKPRQVVSA